MNINNLDNQNKINNDRINNTTLINEVDELNLNKNSFSESNIIKSSSRENILTNFNNETPNIIKDNQNENDTIIKANSKHKEYYKMLLFYFIYLLIGFLGGIFINLISNFKMINFDMLFNIIISPILYYHSPRNILLNLDKNNLIKFYFIPFLIGLTFRFFDRIPGFSQFVLDPYYIKSTLQITLLIIVLTIIISLSIYYIYISSNPILNTTLFICEIVLTILSCYIYLLDNGFIHIHHYFIGLIIMLVSRNYHSKIVIIAHSISYAIYIEGISGFGFDSIFWK